MREFSRLTNAFLAHQGWETAERMPLSGHTFTSQIERLINTSTGQYALLMKSPDDPENITRFQTLTQHLSRLGISVPQIYAALPNNGLLLHEDLGDTTFTHVLAADPVLELELYLAATDLLITLHNTPPPPVPTYDTSTMAADAGLAYRWYGSQDGSEAGTLIQTRLSEVLSALPVWNEVLSLQSFRAENLFWLPERDGTARLGLTNFQNAALSHPIYDLASLAYDLQRDVSRAAVDAIFNHYASATNQSRDTLDQAAAALTAQRNLNLIGLFARLSLHAGNPNYIDLIPRCWELLNNALYHPSLEQLAAAVTEYLPAPNPEILTRLKEKCSAQQNL